MTRVLVASFSADYTNPTAYTESIVGLWGIPRDYYLSYRHYTRKPIHVARREAADAALAGGFDYLCQIDDDQTFPSYSLEQLLKHDVDVVSALSFGRLTPYNPLVFTWFIGNSILPWDRIPEPRGLTKADVTGFGFTLIKTDVLRKLNGDWFGYCKDPGAVAPASPDSTYRAPMMTEDVYFAIRCRDMGIQIYSDTSLQIGHLGPPLEVTEETWAAYKEAQVREALAK